MGEGQVNEECNGLLVFSVVSLVSRVQNEEKRERVLLTLESQIVRVKESGYSQLTHNGPPFVDGCSSDFPPTRGGWDGLGNRVEGVWLMAATGSRR